MRVIIYFYPVHLSRYLRAIGRIERQTPIQLQNMGWRVATDMKQLQIKNIITQKFASHYQDYSPWYKEYKRKYGTTMQFWVLRADLIRSLIVKNTRRTKSETVWFAGIPAHVTNSEGKSIAMIGRTHEYGIGKQPRRALFGPSVVEYVNTGRFRKRGDQVLKTVRRNWR